MKDRPEKQTGETIANEEETGKASINANLESKTRRRASHPVWEK